MTLRWRKEDSNRWSHLRVSTTAAPARCRQPQHPSWVSNPSCQFNQHLCRKWDQRFESAFLHRRIQCEPDFPRAFVSPTLPDDRSGRLPAASVDLGTSARPR
jgi:hypothetical protein